MCVKAQSGNYVGFERVHVSYDIYVKEKAVLGRAYVQAFLDLKIQLGEEIRVPVPEDVTEALAELTLPEGPRSTAHPDEDALRARRGRRPGQEGSPKVAEGR
jgi:CRISPR-associated protein Csd2